MPTTTEVAALLAALGPDAGDIAAALAATGARPGELREARVEHLDGDRLVMPSHKTDKTGRPRVIYLPASVLPIVRRRAAATRSGRIFERGAYAWDRQELARAFRVGCDAAGVKRFTPYAMRHYRCTQWLRAGVPIVHVAELLGHRDTTMIARHYSHLAEHAADLRRAANVA